MEGFSPDRTALLALADIPVAHGVTARSIIASKGDGDYHKGNDGVVAYPSAHIDYAKSEFIVRGPHSCQGMPPTIEEVRRILYEHAAAMPKSVTDKKPVPSAK